MQWGFLKSPFTRKMDVFVNFESAINLEIRGQIKKKIGFLLFGLQLYKDHMSALSSKSGSEPFSFALFWGDLRWNDPPVVQNRFRYSAPQGQG